MSWTKRNIGSYWKDSNGGFVVNVQHGGLVEGLPYETDGDACPLA